MPCTGCDNKEYVGFVKVKYLGTIRDWGGHSFVTGRVYTLPARYANKEAFPLFELVAVMPGTIIPEKYRYIEKRVEVPVEMVPAPVEGEAASEPEESAEEESVETGSPELDVSEAVDVAEYIGTVKDAAAGLTQDDMIAGMDKETLKMYITSMGGKVDSRWGLKKLIEEAQKLQ